MKFLPGFAPRNVQVIHDKNGSSKIVSYESSYMGKELFSIAQIFTRKATPDIWEPGKGLNVPLDQKTQFLANLKTYCNQ